MVTALLVTFQRAAVGGDEALCRDGQRRDGMLKFVDGRLRFFVSDGGKPLELEELRNIKLGGSPAATGPGGGCRVLLPGGQRLSGELLELRSDKLVMRSAWSARLEIPRSAVVAISSLPGWRTRFADPLDDGLQAWSVVGKPRVRAKGPGALVLDRVPQELTYELPTPLLAGRVGVHAQLVANPDGARWQLQACFGPGVTRPLTTLTVTVAGDGSHCTITAPQAWKGVSTPVSVPATAFRLVLQFTSRSLRVSAKGDVLWYSERTGPPEPLRQVRLVCTRGDGAGRPHGSVVWSQFLIEEAVDEPTRPPGDPSQDEVWLATGDQLFGRLLHADGHNLELLGSFGRRRVPWIGVNACYLAGASTSVLPPRGQRGVQLCLDSQRANDADVVEGLLIALNASQWILRHAFLGDVRLSRSSVRWISFLDSQDGPR